MVVIYGLEAWTLSKSDEYTLAKRERKTMTKIFGPIKENGVWGIRTNRELMDLYTEPNIISRHIKGRLQWLGHVERMPEERTLKKGFKNIPEGKRSIGGGEVGRD